MLLLCNLIILKVARQRTANVNITKTSHMQYYSKNCNNY